MFYPDEKRRIRSYLGYSNGFLDKGVRLESMMDKVADDPPAAQYVRTLLNQIHCVDEGLVASGSSGVPANCGQVKKVGNIEFYRPEETPSLNSPPAGWQLGEILIERLRVAMGGVPLGSQYFRRSTMMGQPFPLG